MLPNIQCDDAVTSHCMIIPSTLAGVYIFHFQSGFNSHELFCTNSHVQLTLISKLLLA